MYTTTTGTYIVYIQSQSGDFRMWKIFAFDDLKYSRCGHFHTANTLCQYYTINMMFLDTFACGHLHTNEVNAKLAKISSPQTFDFYSKCIFFGSL